MPRRKPPNLTPSWERRRLIGAVDSELALSAPLFCQIDEGEYEDNHEIVLSERGGAGLAFNDSPPLPTRSIRNNEDWLVQFDGVPIDAVPAFVIDWLLRRNSFFARFPWPYSLAEVRDILSYIPDRSHERVVENIVWRARVFLLSQRVIRNIPPKNNPKAEIKALYEAIGQLNVAIQGLSMDARRHLVGVADLGREVHRFQIANCRVLEDPPAVSEIRGRPVDKQASIRAYYADLFLAAHDGVRPARGQPAFIRSCCAPLGLTHLSNKGVQKAIARKGRQKGT